MLLSEAKQILKKAGFLMESNTKDLVKTFWDKRKAGDTLTKEEAEELLNAPDFDTAVNPKYQNFIKSTCNKILGIIPKPQKPHYNLDDDKKYKSFWYIKFYVRFVPIKEYNGDYGIDGKRKTVKIDIEDQENLKNFAGLENYEEIMNTVEKALSVDPDHIFAKKYNGTWIENNDYSKNVRNIGRIFGRTLCNHEYGGNDEHKHENLLIITCSDGELYNPCIEWETDEEKHLPNEDVIDTRSDSAIKRNITGHWHRRY